MTNVIDDGGCAFPTIEHMCDPRTAGFAGYMGMSLRDYFAAHAIAAFLISDGTTSFKNRAKEAYEVADTMIEARKPK